MKEEKVYENDSTMTPYLLFEAMRATMPCSALVLSLSVGAILLARGVIGCADAVRLHVFDPKLLVYFFAVLLLLSMPFFLLPALCGVLKYRRICRDLSSGMPHATFSFYKSGLTVRLPDGKTSPVPYSSLCRVIRTPRLLILSSKEGEDLLLRLDSFHGSTADDVEPFLRRRIGK